MTALDTLPYHCTGCERRFAGWGELRKHHHTCLRFIEQARPALVEPDAVDWDALADEETSE